MNQLDKKLSYQVKAYKAKMTSAMYGIDVTKVNYYLDPKLAHLSALWNLYEFSEVESHNPLDFYEDQAKLSEILMIMADLKEDGFNTYDLKILSASLFYIYGYPAAANLVVKGLKKEPIKQLNQAIYFLLKKDFKGFLGSSRTIIKIFKLLDESTQEGRPLASLDIIDLIESLREKTISSRGAENILRVVMLEKIIKRYLSVNITNVLDRYSDLPLSKWKNFISLQNKKGISEFWPSQLLAISTGLLNDNPSFAFKMPTSSGKTQSIQLILYNFFIKNGGLSVIIVPYRALLREIERDIADIARLFNVNVNVVDDLKVSSLILGKNVNGLIITTPEKLNFILRDDPDLLSSINLYIVDEGHLFDSESRGVSYELMFTNILLNKSKDSGMIFISAVMPNVDDVIEWIGVNKNNALTSLYKPTITHVGICKKEKSHYLLKFISDTDGLVKNEHYVPNFIKTQKYKIKDKDLIFPEEGNSSSIAAAAGLKSLNLGAVAIFTGQPAWVKSIAKQVIVGLENEFKEKYILDIHEDCKELYDYANNYLGEKHSLTQAFKYGFGIHHGQLLQSYKELVEDSIKEEILPLVVCTSTLAEGVNLPIKTLVIHSAKKGAEDLSRRDFLNLAGRSGRASKEISGNVIFIETSKNRSQIENYVGDIEIENCYSQILKYLVEIHSKSLSVEQAYIDDEFRPFFESLEVFLIPLIQKDADFDAISDQITTRTLSYNQAIKYKREEFNLLLKDSIKLSLIKLNEIPIEELNQFKKMGESISRCIEIKAFVDDQERDFFDSLHTDESLAVMLQFIYEQYSSLIGDITLDEFSNISTSWINGESPKHINQKVEKDINERRKSVVKKHNAKVKKLKKEGNVAPKGKKTVSWNIDSCTNFITNKISYLSSNLIGSLAILHLELSPFEEEGYEKIVLLQKRLKYGLLSKVEIEFQSYGISDRAICHELANQMGEDSSLNSHKWLKDNLEVMCEEVFSDFPEFFEVKVRKQFS